MVHVSFWHQGKKYKILSISKPHNLWLGMNHIIIFNWFNNRLDAAIAATEGKVNLALVDIDNLSDLALDYDVQAVPTVLAVKDGKVS